MGNKYKHPANRYERRLIQINKSKRPKKGVTPMEEFRTIETTVSSAHLKEHLAQFLDAVNLVQPDEHILDIEGLPEGNIPIKIKFTKQIPQDKEVKGNS